MDEKKDINMDLAKGVAKEAVKEIQEERSFAMELINMQKTSCKRQFASMIIAWIVTGIVVLSAMYERLQYDYSSTTEAVGIYTAVDNSGNVIAKDVSEAEWELFMDWLNGKSESNQDKNQ